MQTAPLKQAAVINPEQLPDTADPDMTFRYADVGSVGPGVLSEQLEVLTFADAPSRARRITRAEDVVVSTVRTYLRAVAQIPSSDVPIIASTGLAVLRPRPGVEARYLAYACSSASFIDEVVARSTGVSYPAISPSELARIPLPLPPLDQQRRIAAYLDDATAAIDETLAELDTVERLANERVTAAVTELTRSAGGVDVALSALFSIVNGGTPRKERENWDGPVTWLTPADLRGLDARPVSGSSRTLTLQGLESCSAALVPKGALVLSTRAPIGYVGLLESPVAFSQGCKALVPKRSELVDIRFIAYQILSLRAELQSRGRGTTFMELSNDNLASLRLRIPPVDAQIEAAHACAAVQAAVELVAVEARSQRALLQQRRASLVDAVLRGAPGEAAA